MNERMVRATRPGAGTLESGLGLASSLPRQMVLGLFWRLCLCCILLPSSERVPHIIFHPANVCDPRAIGVLGSRGCFNL